MLSWDASGGFDGNGFTGSFAAYDSFYPSASSGERFATLGIVRIG